MMEEPVGRGSDGKKKDKKDRKDKDKKHGKKDNDGKHKHGGHSPGKGRGRSSRRSSSTYSSRSSSTSSSRTSSSSSSRSTSSSSSSSAGRGRRSGKKHDKKHDKKAPDGLPIFNDKGQIVGYTDMEPVYHKGKVVAHNPLPPKGTEPVLDKKGKIAGYKQAAAAKVEAPKPEAPKAPAVTLSPGDGMASMMTAMATLMTQATSMMAQSRQPAVAGDKKPDAAGGGLMSKLGIGAGSSAAAGAGTGAKDGLQPQDVANAVRVLSQYMNPGGAPGAPGRPPGDAHLSPGHMMNPMVMPPLNPGYLGGPGHVGYPITAEQQLQLQQQQAAALQAGYPQLPGQPKPQANAGQPSVPGYPNLPGYLPQQQVPGYPPGVMPPLNGKPGQLPPLPLPGQVSAVKEAGAMGDRELVGRLARTLESTQEMLRHSLGSPSGQPGGHWDDNVSPYGHPYDPHNVRSSQHVQFHDQQQHMPPAVDRDGRPLLPDAAGYPQQPPAGAGAATLPPAVSDRPKSPPRHPAPGQPQPYPNAAYGYPGQLDPRVQQQQQRYGSPPPREPAHPYYHDPRYGAGQGGHPGGRSRSASPDRFTPPYGPGFRPGAYDYPPEYDVYPPQYHDSPYGSPDRYDDWRDRRDRRDPRHRLRASVDKQTNTVTTISTQTPPDAPAGGRYDGQSIADVKKAMGAAAHANVPGSALRDAVGVPNATQLDGYYAWMHVNRQKLLDEYYAGNIAKDEKDKAAQLRAKETALKIAEANKATKQVRRGGRAALAAVRKMLQLRNWRKCFVPCLFVQVFVRGTNSPR